MEEDTVVALPRPGSGVTDDALLAVLREGARRMLTQAIEAEVEAFLATHAGLVDQQGRRRLVRNGHAPERQIQTGIGPLDATKRGSSGTEHACCPTMGLATSPANWPDGWPIMPSIMSAAHPAIRRPRARSSAGTRP